MASIVAAWRGAQTYQHQSWRRGISNNRYQWHGVNGVSNQRNQNGGMYQRSVISKTRDAAATKQRGVATWLTERASRSLTLIRACARIISMACARSAVFRAPLLLAAQHHPRA